MKETNSVNEKKLKPPEIEAIVKKNNRKLTGYCGQSVNDSFHQ